MKRKNMLTFCENPLYYIKREYCFFAINILYTLLSLDPDQKNIGWGLSFSKVIITFAENQNNKYYENLHTH